MSALVPSLPDEPFVVVSIVSTDEPENIFNVLNELSKGLYRHYRVSVCENAGEAAFTKLVKKVGELAVLEPTTPDADNPREEVATPFPYAAFRIRDTGQLVTVLKAPANLGYSRGNNANILSAGRAWDAAWVLNPDTFPEPDALGALVRRLSQGGYGMIGSRILDARSDTVQAWGGFTWNPLLRRGHLLGFRQPRHVRPQTEDIERKLGVISGASMFVSRAFVEAQGLMDEDFFVYQEDVEWSLRRGPFKLGYAHDSVIRHVFGSTSGSATTPNETSRFCLYLNERNRVLLARKQHPAWWPVFAVTGLAVNLAHLFKHMSSLRPYRIILHGWCAGIAGETGMPGFMRSKAPSLDTCAPEGCTVPGAEQASS